MAEAEKPEYTPPFHDEYFEDGKWAPCAEEWERHVGGRERKTWDDVEELRGPFMTAFVEPGTYRIVDAAGTVLEHYVVSDDGAVFVVTAPYKDPETESHAPGYLCDVLGTDGVRLHRTPCAMGPSSAVNYALSWVAKAGATLEPESHPELQEGYRDIDVDAIEPSPYQRRVIRNDDPKLKELATSIREKGVLQPVVVRPHPDPAGAAFELICGHRRLVASRIASRTTIPAIVRHVDDQAAREMCALENLQREDLSPLEEAEQVSLLLESGYDAEAAAKAIGRTKKWVYTRAQLVHLTDAWKGAISAGVEWLQYWGVGHYELIAQLGPECQGQIFEKYEGRWGAPTISRLAGEIANLTRVLGKAPFDLHDEDLVPDAPACGQCQKRKGVIPDLFDIDADIPLEQDTCRDGLCYERKRQAHLEARLKEEKAQEPSTLLVEHRDWAWNGNQHMENVYEDNGRYYEKCKKTDPGAIPAIRGGDGGTGTKLHVRPVKSSGGRPGKGVEDTRTVGERRKALKETRERSALDRLSRDLKEMPWPGGEAGPSIIEMVKVLVLSHPYLMEDARLKEAKRLADVADETELRELLWPVATRAIQNDIPYRINAQGVAIVCDWLKIDWAAYQNAAAERNPEPKTWKGLKASDVPGKAKAKKPAKKSKTEAA